MLRGALHTFVTHELRALRPWGQTSEGQKMRDFSTGAPIIRERTSRHRLQMVHSAIYRLLPRRIIKYVVPPPDVSPESRVAPPVRIRGLTKW